MIQLFGGLNGYVVAIAGLVGFAVAALVHEENRGGVEPPN
jgi:hypothetical protein